MTPDLQNGLSRHDTEPVEGEVWQRIDGGRTFRRITVHRVWEICDCPSVTMHSPCKEGNPVGAVLCVSPGGADFWTTFPEFLKRYEHEAAADA